MPSATWESRLIPSLFEGPAQGGDNGFMPKGSQMAEGFLIVIIEVGHRLFTE